MTREEAIKWQEAFKRTYGNFPPEATEACDKAIEALKEPERKKGQWVDGESKCPVCGEDKFKNLDADIWADWKPPFCPNCGADMRGEQTGMRRFPQLVEILTEAFELGHNVESKLDRELFAQYLISKGVTIDESRCK